MRPLLITALICMAGAAFMEAEHVETFSFALNFIAACFVVIVIIRGPK